MAERRIQSDLGIQRLETEGHALSVRVMPSSTGWGYAVIEGEGTEPGSLHAAEFCFDTFDDAWMAARPELKRAIKMAECAHEFVNGRVGRSCRLCKYHDWNQTSPERGFAKP